MTSLIVAAKPKVRRPARTLQQLFERPRKGVQAAVGISSLRKMIPSPACRRSRGRRGGGISNFRLQQKRPKTFAPISPRSGRTKIAQQFSAGYEVIFRTAVHKADDRIIVRHSSPTSLSPVSRALGKD